MYMLRLTKGKRAIRLTIVAGTDLAHTSDLHLVHQVSGFKREVRRVADALEELIAMKRAKTDSEVKSEVPSEDSDSE